MEERKRLTVYLSPVLLQSIKVESVKDDVTYSDRIASLLKKFITQYPTDTVEFVKKYQHYVNFIPRGRPSGEFLKSHGPVLQKKATFYVNKKLTGRLSRRSRDVGLSVSCLTELAIKVYLKEKTQSRSHNKITP